MRIALILIAAGAFFVAGCKTTETASTDGHRVFVKIDKHHIMNDKDGETKHVKFVIADGKGGLTVIEGGPSDPEIELQIAQLKASGMLTGVSGLDDKQVIIKKSDAGKSRHVIIMKSEDDGEAMLHMDATHQHAEHDGDGDVQMHKEIIIIRGENEEEVRARLKEHGIELDIELELELDVEDEEVEG